MYRSPECSRRLLCLHPFELRAVHRATRSSNIAAWLSSYSPSPPLPLLDLRPFLVTPDVALQREKAELHSRGRSGVSFQQRRRGRGRQVGWACGEQGAHYFLQLSVKVVRGEIEGLLCSTEGSRELVSSTVRIQLLLLACRAP